MSWCCQGVDPEYKYEVKSLVENEHGGRESYKYYNSLDDVDHLVLENQTVSITKIKTQIGLNDLKQKIKKDGQKFTDTIFPPEKSSLGDIPGNISWKRIPEVLGNKQLVVFDKKIEPSDVITGHLGDCYLLSSLAALAEFPEIIRKIFRDQTANPEGLYKVNLRVDGAVEEVVIDDFIPVHENGQPVFCQPNKKTGQIWVVLLEKALAKVSGSYANLNQGVPSEVFRQVTYAPSESLVFSDGAEEKKRVWNLLKEETTNRYPFCATTKVNASTKDGLESSHTYTVIAAEQLEGTQGQVRVVKLRNPWKEVNYRGAGSASDSHFWDKIQESQLKSSITGSGGNNGSSYGLFTMSFDEFCHNFDQIHYCNLNSGGKFLSEELLLSNKACFFDVSVQREGQYTFEINQAKSKKHSHPPASDNKHPAEAGIDNIQKFVHDVKQAQHYHPNEDNHVEYNHYPHEASQFPAHSYQKENEEDKINQEETACRSTLLLIRKEKAEHGFRYVFLNGTMKYNETNTVLTERLNPGDYVVYAKIDPFIATNKFPESATINLYSKNFAKLEPVIRSKYPTLVHDALLDHAIHNKRNEYSGGKIWMSWQLFFQKGGFAYLAGGNSLDSEQTVVINFSEQDFHQLHFKIKKPLKGQKNPQTIRISPGEAKILIARVINNPSVKSVKFPPKLDIKLEPFHQ